MKGFKYFFAACFAMAGATLFLGSCEEKKTTGVLSPEEMVKVMSEIYIAEDKINRLSLGPDSSRKVFNIMNKKIAEKTGVSDSLFRLSLEHYSSRPREMEKIYTALVDSLNLKEQRSPLPSQ